MGNKADAGTCAFLIEKKYGLLLTEQAVPVLFTSRPRQLLRSNRAFCQAAGHYACDLFIGSTLQNDLEGIARKCCHAARQEVVARETRTHAHQVTYGAEMLNVFNRHHFAWPDTSIGSPTFGYVTSTSGDARVIQIGLRLGF